MSSGNLSNRERGDYLFSPNTRLALWLADRAFSLTGEQLRTNERAILVQAYLSAIGHMMAEDDYRDENTLKAGVNP